jgi:hypothetical protein
MGVDRSWATASVDPETFKSLSEGLSGSDLWSLLLDVLDQRAKRRTPAEVLRQWERDGFTRPAVIDQRTFLEIDSHLLGSASAFEAIELSPLAPLGACSAIGLASQNKIVSALRGTEVVSDPTNVLALECARRLREPVETVRLATSHRCVRAQPFPKKPGYAPHFRIFCLATAGRERKERALLIEAMSEHIRTHLVAIERLERSGYAFPPRTVRLLSTPELASTADRIEATLSGIPVERQVLAHPYYDGLRFMISVGLGEGSEIPFVDGGAFDWVAKLTSNRRLVFVASGMGAQLIPTLFRAK